VDVDPVGDRLLVFWADQLVHGGKHCEDHRQKQPPRGLTSLTTAWCVCVGVRPSYAPNGAADNRYALTVWLTATHQVMLDDHRPNIEHQLAAQPFMQPAAWFFFTTAVLPA
jgi:hypothetical protein